MVALDPDELPATATAQRFLEAAAGLESARRLEAARMAYARATRTWPDEPLAWLGTGNTEYALGDLERAVDSFRRALELDPDDLVARNNLAQVLAETGCVEAARAQIARAEARAAGTSFEAAVAATSADVRAAALASEPAARRLRCDEVVAAPPE
jgi:tetratricopeptide (TPR) repeat protein